MISRQRRMAGQALAALPEENITEQLSASLDRLRQVTPEVPIYADYVDKNYPVRGETNNVTWATAPTDVGVAFGPDGYNKFEGEFQIGNAAEIKRIEDAGISDVFEIAWYSPELEQRPGIPNAPTRNSLADTESIPAAMQKKQDLQDKRTALGARSAWPDFLAGIPDDVLLHNRPVGGMSGDYGRADLYMREGFGPVGENGAQYAIKRNGQLEAVAPMGTHKDYAIHLMERLGNSGEGELSGTITNELQRRRANRESLMSPDQLDYERRQREYEMNGDYDDSDYDDGDWTDDYDSPDYAIDPERRRRNAELDFERIDRFGSQNQVRDVWNELEDSHTMNTVYAQGLRNRQAEIAQELSSASDNLNFANQHFPRPVPMPITSSPFVAPEDRVRFRGGTQPDFFNDANELADAVRGGSEYYMAEGTPENLRGYVKTRFARPQMRADGVLEMRENYGPKDVQLLRDLQVQQAMNPIVEGSGPASGGISTPLDVLSSDVPVQWIAQDGTPRGPAAPITGAGGSERSMAMRRNNWVDNNGQLHRGHTIFGHNADSALQKFVDASNGDPTVLFPGRNVAPSWDNVGGPF